MEHDPRNLHGYENLIQILGEDLGNSLYECVGRRVVAEQRIAELEAQLAEAKLELDEAICELVNAYNDDWTADRWKKYIKEQSKQRGEDASR